MIELYSDYLIASFGQTTATGLANLLQGSIYHDSITHFLNSETLTAKEQWQLIKPMLRQHENATPNAIGYLIFRWRKRDSCYSLLGGLLLDICGFEIPSSWKS